MSISKAVMMVGTGIAVAVSVSFSILLLHASNEKEARDGIEKRTDRVEAIVMDGLRELRQDVKELLRR